MHEGAETDLNFEAFAIGFNQLSVSEGDITGQENYLLAIGQLRQDKQDGGIGTIPKVFKALIVDCGLLPIEPDRRLETCLWWGK